MKFMNKEIGEALSPAVSEVLAVVAYRGPLTRAQIEYIRGVNCCFTLRNLAMRGLVERKENPDDSRSYLYEISFDFLNSLGIKKVQELPEYEELIKKQEESINELKHEN
jgi:segregation and condensation protein B